MTGARFGQLHIFETPFNVCLGQFLTNSLKSYLSDFVEHDLTKILEINKQNLQLFRWGYHVHDTAVIYFYEIV